MTQTLIESQPPTIMPQPLAPTPQHKLMRIGGLIVLIGLLVGLLLWWWRPYPFHGIVLQSPEPATDFTLTASTGAPLRLSDLRGKVVLLYFGYTACPDACPLTLADLTQTMQLLGKPAEKVQVILVSVDPQHDTPQRLARYVTAFDPTFLGMTGAPATIEAVATQFGIFYDGPQPLVNSTEQVYPVNHTSNIVVIDPAGYVRLLFPTGTTPADMASDLKYLIGR